MFYKAMFTLALASSLMSVNAQASTQIRCEKNGVQIGLFVDSFVQAQPPRTSYVVYQNGKLVKTGLLKKVDEGFESSFMNAYLWLFEDSSAGTYIGVATKEFPNAQPQKGAWTGKADILISLPGGPLDLASVDCSIEVQ